MAAVDQHWLALIRASGVGPALGRRLLERFGSAQAVFAAGRTGWRECGADAAVCAALATPDMAGVAQDVAWLEAAPNRYFVRMVDAHYPARLEAVGQAPLGLFVEGDVEALALPQLGVVGSRNPTPQGARAAQEFAGFLSRNGLVITSGLALGIDGAAHVGALKADGLTVAVLGCGLDNIYPTRHRHLAFDVAHSGALVSEYPTGVVAQPHHFPRRNRIISGLSLGVLVVEAALQSGSLITAQQAMEQGREVFAIPGSIHNPLARGCHRLLRDGAKLVETGADILEELAGRFELSGGAVDNAQPTAEAGATDTTRIDGDYLRLLSVMGDAPCSIDTLVEYSGLTPAAVSSMLLILELEGRVAAMPGGNYMKISQ